MFERRDVEIADQDRPAVGDFLGMHPGRHFIEEGELVGELVVDLRIGFVAAGRHVEIMDLDARRLAAQRHMHVARIALAAEFALGLARMGRRETMATP